MVGLRLYLDTQWFVGVSNGRVAIFRGVPTEVAGFELHSVVVETSIPGGRRPRPRVVPGPPRPGSRPIGRAETVIVESIRDDVARFEQPTSRSRVAAPRSRTSLAPSIASRFSRWSCRGRYVIAGYGKRGQLPATFVLYATIFAAGYAGALLAIRAFAPRADPALFPTAAVLVGLLRDDLPVSGVRGRTGDVDRGRPDRPRSRDRRARRADARRLHLHDRASVWCCCSYRSCPASGRPSTAPGSGFRSVRWFQPGRDRQGPRRDLPRLVPTQKTAQVATARSALRLPPAKHLGPVLLAWGASLAILFLQRDLGASLLYFGIFVVMLWVATGRAAYLVIGLILFIAGAHRVAAVRPRPAPRRHLAPRARPGQGLRPGLRAACRRSSGWRAAVSSARASARARRA